MTDERQGDDELSNPTFASDAERAEHEWLIAREANPEVAAPSAEVARRYAHLEQLLTTLPAPVPDRAEDAQWQEALLKRAATDKGSLAPTRRPRTRRAVVRWVVGAALAAAAILLIFLYPRKPTIDPSTSVELAYTIIHAGTIRATPKDVAIHDYFEARLPRGENDLRLFRPDGTLAARCPAGPGCVNDPSGSQIQVSLDVPGRYAVFLVVGTTAIPLDSTKAEFLEHVRVARARLEPPKVFDVQ